jgi:hypothetical protein
VGIAWQGTPAFRYDRERSMPLEQFAPLTRIPGVRLISLQKGPGAEQLDRMVDPGAEQLVRLVDPVGRYKFDRQRSMPLAQFARMKDEKDTRSGSSSIPRPSSFMIDDASGPFMDTAAIIENLDLVITSDTAVPHLAGALACPVWVALAWIPDWRWMLKREDSPWYPTMRLFRQTRQGLWEDVFERIVNELKLAVGS